jgi:hypothetical protein
MHRSYRPFVVLLLVLLLLPSALQAAEPLRSGPSALLSWDLLTRAWSFLTGSQADNGCEVDPDGRRCLAHQTSKATVDNGCEFDPNGRRCLAHQVSIVTADNGCELDPSGRCQH